MEFDLKEPPEIDQMKQDELYKLKRNDTDDAGQIRISLQWIYSKKKLLEDILTHLRYQIYFDQAAYMIASKEIEMRTKPFGGFLKTTIIRTARDDKNLVTAF